MSMSDPLGDMLTRIRNGQSAFKRTVECPASKFRGRVLEVLKREGYIRGYTSREISAGITTFDIELKYDQGQPVIRELHRVSRPGRRVYSNISDLKPYFNNLGIFILSTSRGVMSDHDARREKVGGEVLAKIF